LVSPVAAAPVVVVSLAAASAQAKVYLRPVTKSLLEPTHVTSPLTAAIVAVGLAALTIRCLFLLLTPATVDVTVDVANQHP